MRGRVRACVRDCLSERAVVMAREMVVVCFTSPVSRGAALSAAVARGEERGARCGAGRTDSTAGADEERDRGRLPRHGRHGVRDGAAEQREEQHILAPEDVVPDPADHDARRDLRELVGGLHDAEQLRAHPEVLPVVRQQRHKESDAHHVKKDDHLQRGHRHAARAFLPDAAAAWEPRIARESRGALSSSP